MRSARTARSGVTALSLLVASCGSDTSPTSPNDAGATPEACSVSFDAPPPYGGTQRVLPPTRWMLGPIYGTGCPDFGACETGGMSMRDEINHHLDQLEQNDIPITSYHFDGSAWGSAPCTWGLGPALIERLRELGARALLHFWGGSPFDRAGGCVDERSFETARTTLGPALGGFYLDEGATDELARVATDWVRRVMPDEGELVMKDHQDDEGETPAGLAAYGHSAYVNDLPADFDGLKEGIRRVLSLATVLPAPFNEFTGYDPAARPESETFFRRIHFGAMQPVMDHSPWTGASPWASPYDDALLEDYRYFAWLHRELVPYFHSYDYAAYETGAPIFRDTDPERFSTRLGEELFVTYVTEAGVSELDVSLPAGEWIDYWNPARSFAGPGTIRHPAPLGNEPIFIRRGAIIPMEVTRDTTGHGTRGSAGSLTVVVYPHGHSSFRYRDHLARSWNVFAAQLDGAALTLGASQPPSQPLLFRIEGWPAAPRSVSVCASTVRINQGGSLVEAGSEEVVNGSRVTVWFYDVRAQRLIVKLVP